MVCDEIIPPVIVLTKSELVLKFSEKKYLS